MAAARLDARLVGTRYPTSGVYLRERLGVLFVLVKMPRETWRRLDGSLGFAGNRVLQVPGFPLRLASHAAGRVGPRREPLVPHLSSAVLADAVGSLGLAVA